jgi:predicted NBD/HSP70 family sugar kinase
VAFGEEAKARILTAVLGEGSISRAGLAASTGLSPSRITKVVAPVVESGILKEVGVAVSVGPGRPERMLAVNRNCTSVVGIKLAPTAVTGVLTDMNAEITVRAVRRLYSHKPEPIMLAAHEVYQELRSVAVANRIPPAALGVGVGEHVNTGTGVCVWSGIMDWPDVDIAGPLRVVTGLPVVVSNDVNTLAVAEHWFGRGRGTESFAVVTTGAGVGCGLVLRGRLYTGVSGLAGELGHLPLQPDGPECTCGNRGCLETVASDRAILRFLQDKGVRDCRSVQQAMRLAQDEQTAAGTAAREAFAVTGHALGRGLAALCNLLNLNKVILSGEGAIAYPLFRSELESSWRKHSFSTAADDCDLIIDLVDDDQWARGAACLAIQELVSSARMWPPGSTATTRSAARPGSVALKQGDDTP